MYTPYILHNYVIHASYSYIHNWVIYTSPTFEYNYPCTNFCAQLRICMYSFAHIYFDFTDPMCIMGNCVNVKQNTLHAVYLQEMRQLPKGMHV